MPRVVAATTLGLALAMTTPTAASGQTAYALTTVGASCTQTPAGVRICTYKVGRDLEISITAVGQDDAGTSVLRSNANGDFYARTCMLHRCIIVSAGVTAPRRALEVDWYAFVSPRTGLVYRTWQACDQAK